MKFKHSCQVLWKHSGCCRFVVKHKRLLRILFYSKPKIYVSVLGGTEVEARDCILPYTFNFLIVGKLVLGVMLARERLRREPAFTFG